jgi:hypothetical protein
MSEWASRASLNETAPREWPSRANFNETPPRERRSRANFSETTSWTPSQRIWPTAGQRRAAGPSSMRRDSSNGAAIGRPKSASCQVPTAVGYSNTGSRSEARGPPPVTPMRPGYLHLGTRRNDPTAHSPTVSAADIPTSPGCAPGSEPTHRRSELRSRRTGWPQYRSNAL